MVLDQLATDEPLSTELVSDMQVWKGDYPWLHQAIKAIGPGAGNALDGWRVRIEEDLKTTLDFKVRPDGTAAVWCGMSGHDFHHHPTPKELFVGLGEAYRQERKRVAGSNPWKMSTGARPASLEWAKPKPDVRDFLPPPEDSLTRTVGAVLVPRVEQLTLIFLGVTVLTLFLASIAIAVR